MKSRMSFGQIRPASHSVLLQSVVDEATDIWTHHPAPKFLQMCHKGDLCYVADSRGSKKLQAKCTDEIKRINGAVTFENAYRFQNE